MSAPAYAAPPATLPQHGAAATSVIARPDVVTLTFALRTLADDADVGVALLEQSVKTLEPRFAEIAPKGTLKMKMRGTLVERASGVRSKSAKKAKAEGAPDMDPFAVSLQGTFEYALAPAQDYWSRSHEVARITGLAASVTAASRVEGAAFTATFGGADVHVRDLESFRAELVQKWSARKRQSARDVKSGDVAVTPETCRFGGDITEHVLSIEEIELALPADCKSTVGAAPRAGGPLQVPVTE